MNKLMNRDQSPTNSGSYLNNIITETDDKINLSIGLSS